MQSYLTIDNGKAETVLFKMGLCLWICSDSKIKSVHAFQSYSSLICNICVYIYFSGATFIGANLLKVIAYKN